MPGSRLRERLRSLEHTAAIARQASCDHRCHGPPKIIDLRNGEPEPERESDGRLPSGRCPTCGRPAAAITHIVVEYARARADA